jgi:hypothetical protein
MVAGCFLLDFILFLEFVYQALEKPSSELDRQIIGFEERPASVMFKKEKLFVNELLILRR